MSLNRKQHRIAGRPPETSREQIEPGNQLGGIDEAVFEYVNGPLKDIREERGRSPSRVDVEPGNALSCVGSTGSTHTPDTILDQTDSPSEDYLETLRRTIRSDPLGRQDVIDKYTLDSLTQEEISPNSNTGVAADYLSEIH